VEDTWNFWPLVKDAFESRVPFKKAVLNNKTRNAVALDKLPVEFITSTDSRLRSRPEGQRTPFWFRHPYCHLIVVTCEVSPLFEFGTSNMVSTLLFKSTNESHPESCATCY
jgi:hypothetical protein